MAVSVRLRSQGSTNHITYRMVVADRRSPRDGKYIECIGTYDPFASDNDKKVQFKPDRLQHWLDAGAQMSESVESLVKLVQPTIIQALYARREKALAKRRKK